MEGMSIQYDGQIDFMHQHAGRGGTLLLRARSWIAFCLIIPALLVLKGPWQCPGFIGATLFVFVRRIISITESSHVWPSLLDQYLSILLGILQFSPYTAQPKSLSSASDV